MAKTASVLEWWYLRRYTRWGDTADDDDNEASDSYGNGGNDDNNDDMMFIITIIMIAVVMMIMMMTILIYCHLSIILLYEPYLKLGVWITAHEIYKEKNVKILTENHFAMKKHDFMLFICTDLHGSQYFLLCYTGNAFLTS